LTIDDEVGETTKVGECETTKVDDATKVDDGKKQQGRRRFALLVILLSPIHWLFV
jgi:hypothetical protein